MRRFTLALLALLIALPVSAAPPDRRGFEKVASLTLGETAGDFRVEPIPDGMAEQAEALLIKGARIAADGRLLDPLSGRQATLATQAGQPSKPGAFTLAAPGILQDHRLSLDGNSVWLLVYDGERTLAGCVPRNDEKLVVAPSDLAPIAGDYFARIVAATADGLILLDATGTTLARVAFAALPPRAGAAPTLTRRAIDPWGAALDPDTGRILTLRANGGAVNTVIAHGPDLVPLDACSLVTGETGEVTLEAALPGGRLLLSAVRPTPAGVRREFLLCDSLGGVTALCDVGPHSFLRRGFVRDGRLVALDFKPETVTAGTLDLYARPLEPIAGLPDGSRAAFRPADRLAVLAGRGVLTVNGNPVADVPPPLAALLAAPFADCLFGADGRLYLYDPARRTLGSAAVDAAGALSDPRAVALAAPGTAETPLLHPCVDASGEIYLTNPEDFSLRHYAPDGSPLGRLADLAGVIPGAAGELFMIAEGRSASHKVLLEYDGDGNYMRILHEVQSDKPDGRSSGAFVAGKDAAGRVVFVYQLDGAYYADRIDYRTGKPAGKRTRLKFDPAGWVAAARPFAVAPDGKLWFGRFTADAGRRTFGTIGFDLD